MSAAPTPDNFRAELESAAGWANSYTLLPALLNLAPSTGHGEIWNTWFSVLGQEWSRCDNIGVHWSSLRRLLLKHRDCWRHMMTEAELGALAALPATVIIFRGCGAENKLGLSWSLSREVAASFPFFTRYRTTRPRLITACVPKSRIVGVKNDRDEHEVIALVRPAELVAEQRLKAKLDKAA